VILFACDHAGIELKQALMQRLDGSGRAGHDLGTFDAASVDYPDLAHLLADQIRSGAADRGVLVCGTGLGMSMAANRHPGIRAAVCHDAYTAEMARRHNDANVLCLGSRVLGQGVAGQILDVFLTTPFDGDRHARRVAKIERPGAQDD
jgi:ribose 5-phosphate isomerase B